MFGHGEILACEEMGEEMTSIWATTTYMLTNTILCSWWGWGHFFFFPFENLSESAGQKLRNTRQRV